MEPLTPDTPVVFAVFGGGGDLTHRLVLPALYMLFLEGRLPREFGFIGLDQADMSEEDYREHLRAGVEKFSHQGAVDTQRWNVFAEHVGYFKSDINDSNTYAELARRLGELDGQWSQPASRIFYLATPPRFFGVIPTKLAEAGLSKPLERARIVVEKPLGRDLQSARELNQQLTTAFAESQVFRIDHYLGKETVQNILAFRFANPMFEPIWNRRYVDHVAITVAEEIGVEHRGGYYEKAGCLRDMVQNHLMQLLCLTAMEAPVSFKADEVRNKKVDVLHAVRPIPEDEVYKWAVRGQYGAGWDAGQHVPSYRHEDGVAEDSGTETFAAVKLMIDNWRWQGVPFYLRTGKRLARQVNEISIRFHQPPHQTFPASAQMDWRPTRLVMCIQPEQGIVLKFQAKQPGTVLRLRPVDMRFNYQEAFQERSPDAYETLLWDVMTNDATLFMRTDQIEAAWSLLTPVLDVWGDAPPTDFPNYAAGTWGPESASRLIAQDGRNWFEPTRLVQEED